MRTFLPLLPVELLAGDPPAREPVSMQVPAGLREDDVDALHEEALDEAAFASLELLLTASPAADGLLSRVVAVGEDSPQRWEDFAAFYLDDEHTRSLIDKAARAESQEHLDELVEEISGTYLDWYDPSELEEVRAQIRAAGAPVDV